jgi:hypothetical protein
MARYEIHRPADAPLESRVKELSEHRTKIFREARERAGTGGPLMVDGRVYSVVGPEMERIVRSAFLRHIEPCQKDPTTGQYFIGAFVYVPVIRP